jgi:hypothetical protein
MKFPILNVHILLEIRIYSRSVPRLKKICPSSRTSSIPSSSSGKHPFNIWWHIDSLLGNGCETARQQPLLGSSFVNAQQYFSCPLAAMEAVFPVDPLRGYIYHSTILDEVVSERLVSGVREMIVELVRGLLRFSRCELLQ